MDGLIADGVSFSCLTKWHSPHPMDGLIADGVSFSCLTKWHSPHP